MLTRDFVKQRKDLLRRVKLILGVSYLFVKPKYRKLSINYSHALWWDKVWRNLPICGPLSSDGSYLVRAHCCSVLSVIGTTVILIWWMRKQGWGKGGFLAQAPVMFTAQPSADCSQLRSAWWKGHLGLCDAQVVLTPDGPHLFQSPFISVLPAGLMIL